MKKMFTLIIRYESLLTINNIGNVYIRNSISDVQNLYFLSDCFAKVIVIVSSMEGM